MLVVNQSAYNAFVKQMGEAAASKLYAVSKPLPVPAWIGWDLARPCDHNYNIAASRDVIQCSLCGHKTKGTTARDIALSNKMDPVVEPRTITISATSITRRDQAARMARHNFESSHNCLEHRGKLSTDGQLFKCGLCGREIKVAR